jgi:hypothetical protein
MSGNQSTELPIVFGWTSRVGVLSNPKRAHVICVGVCRTSVTTTVHEKSRSSGQISMGSIVGLPMNMSVRESMMACCDGSSNQPVQVEMSPCSQSSVVDMARRSSSGCPSMVTTRCGS